MDRLIRKIKGKGKGKEPEIILPKFKAPDRLSRVHLIVDPDNPSRYSYHLHPLMPALYHMLVEDENGLDLVLENISMILQRVFDGREVGNTVFERESSYGQSQTVLEVDLEGDIRVFVQASFQPKLILARWSMEVSLFDHENFLDQSENTSLEDNSDENDVPAKKVDKAVAVVRPPNEKSTHDDVPPPPYEGNRPPPEYEQATSSKEHYQVPPVYLPTKVESSEPHTEKNKNYYDSFPNPPPTWGREAEFVWGQVSSRARIKLTCTARKEVFVEFIQETDAKKMADGVKGQLLFRKSCGCLWETAVLLTLGTLMELSKGKVWDE